MNEEKIWEGEWSGLENYNPHCPKCGKLGHWTGRYRPERDMICINPECRVRMYSSYVKEKGDFGKEGSFGETNCLYCGNMFHIGNGYSFDFCSKKCADGMKKLIEKAEEDE